MNERVFTCVFCGATATPSPDQAAAIAALILDGWTVNSDGQWRCRSHQRPLLGSDAPVNSGTRSRTCQLPGS